MFSGVEAEKDGVKTRGERVMYGLRSFSFAHTAFCICWQPRGDIDSSCEGIECKRWSARANPTHSSWSRSRMLVGGVERHGGGLGERNSDRFRYLWGVGLQNRFGRTPADIVYCFHGLETMPLHKRGYTDNRWTSRRVPIPYRNC